MREEFEVVIIGAGSAGLTAVKEVSKVTKSFLLIDKGPLGTTCSRVGCMPSKVFIQTAYEFSSLHRLKKIEAAQGEVTANLPKVMEHVRELRDYFVEFAVKDTLNLGENFLQGEARFIGPNLLRVGDREIHAKSVIVATGSSPVMNEGWEKLGSSVVTTDQFFELKDIKKDWAVIGLGPLGLEIGSALAKFGCKVHAFQRSGNVGGLKDSAVAEKAREIFADIMELHLNTDVELSKRGEKICVSWKGKETLVDQVLVSIGRRPNTGLLDLPKTLCSLDKRGVPEFNPETLQAKTSDPKLKMFVAGDFSSDRPILHEASDEGRLAGFNALQQKPKGYRKRTRLMLTFSLPGLAAVGEPLAKLEDPLIGKVDFANQGRAKINGANKGVLRVYADRGTGLIRGAEMIGPEAEHIGHILAGAISQKVDVRAMLRQPYYHPTVMEGLRTALREIDKALETKRPPGPELEPMPFHKT